jgi:hypothetical protein
MDMLASGTRLVVDFEEWIKSPDARWPPDCRTVWSDG